jgi:preprotein translocase subunit YajC
MSKTKKRNILISISALVLVCILAVVFYFVSTSSNRAENDGKTQQNTTQEITPNKQDNDKESIRDIHAKYNEYKNVKDFYTGSKSIIVGTVKSIEEQDINIAPKGEEAQYYPYDVYTIENVETIKGDTRDKQVKIKVLLTDEMPQIELNSKYLFSTRTFPDSYDSLTNMTQSVYKITGEKDGQLEGAVVEASGEETDPVKFPLSDILELAKK